MDIERQKQLVHEYLFSNNEAITRVQKEIKTATSGRTRVLDPHCIIIIQRTLGLVFGVFGGFIIPGLLLHTELMVSLFIR